MSQEIEAWARIVNGSVMSLCCSKEDAEELARLKGGTVVKLTGKMPSVDDDFTQAVVDGVTYYDAKKECTHQEALDLAAKHGLRVMESWEMHKLWIESENFRKSADGKWFWGASVVSDYRDNAWRFYGYGGGVGNYYRSGTGGVRCVALP